jgi:septal ring factor EnvC (AmiA/AmiB activator)
MSDTSTKRAEEVAYNLQLSGISGSTWSTTEVEASNMLRALAVERDALRAENDKLRAENAKLAASNHAYLSDYQEAAAEIEKLRAENERLTNNARSDARLLAVYHKWCEMHGCAPSSGDLLKARAALGEKDDAKV